VRICPSDGEGGCECEDAGAIRAGRRGLAPPGVAIRMYAALADEGVFGSCTMMEDAVGCPGV